MVAETTIDATTFLLHDEGDGCVALEIRHPGMQSTVERRCFERDNVLDVSTTCGWLTQPEAAADIALALSIAIDCDVDLPPVLFGRVTDPSIGYVCLGTLVEDAEPPIVDTARFLDFDPSGYILEPAIGGEAAAAHLFTPDGLRYGTPPLDAPSAPIYEACERLAPWGAAGSELAAELRIEAGDELHRESISVFVDTGLDHYGVSGDAFAREDRVDFPGRIAASSAGVIVRVEQDGAEVFAASYDWPAELAPILDSESPCLEPIVVTFTVANEVFDGDRDAVTVEMQPSDCGARQSR